MLLVPTGFVMLWEAQITWPRVGSAHHWQRRSAGLVVALVRFASVVVLAELLRAALPDGWIGHTLAQGAGGWAGALIFLRLNRCVSRRFHHETSGTPRTAAP